MDNYSVDFNIPNLSLFEQDEVYNKLMKLLPPKIFNNMEIIVTDPVGGKHYMNSQYGVKPGGDMCFSCLQINCSLCPSFKEQK